MNGLENCAAANLEKVFEEHINIFRSSLFSSRAADVKSLKVVLKKNAKPTQVRLRR